MAMETRKAEAAKGDASGASGVGFTATSDGESLGGAIDIRLTDGDGSDRLRIRGVTNITGGPKRGACVLCEAGVGGVTATTGQSEADLQAELPSGFEIAAQGTTFTASDFTEEVVVTIGSTQYKEFRTLNQVYFGGAIDALDPVYSRWAATTYAAATRVRSSDPTIDLVTTAGGTDTAPEPVPDGNFGGAISGGTLNDWIQQPAIDLLSVSVDWSDTSLEGAATETVKEFILKSYKTARIIAQRGETLDSDRQNHGLDLLNDMLHGWDIEGIGVNHVDLGINDSMPYEKGHLVFLRQCLAMDLVLDTGNEITPLLAMRAEEGKETMREYFDQAPLLAVDTAIHPYYNTNRNF